MEIVCLRGGEYEARILPEYGANCIELINTKYDCSVFIPFESITKMQEDNSFFYGMPVLFPPNRISGGKFSFEGQEYIFPINEPTRNNFIHGDLYRSKFEIVRKEKSMIEMEYKATQDEPYYAFPHAFTIRLKYELNNNGLFQTIIVKNNFDKSMPFGMGFHTTFRLPFVNKGNIDNIELFLSAEKELYRDMNSLLPTGEELLNSRLVSKMQNGKIDLNNSELSALIKDNGMHKAMLIDKSSNLSLIYETDENYCYWMVYKEKDRNCISIEPQTWITNAPNLPFSAKQTGMQIILPNQSVSICSKIYLKEGE